MINASTPTLPQSPPPPPDEGQVSTADNGSQLSPTLTQTPDKDEVSGSGTQSSDDESQQTRRGIKRQWRQTTTASQSQDPITSSAPALKRQRTAASVAQESEIFSRHFDTDLIALVRKHGGQILDRQGDMIVLTLPPRDNLEFKVEFTCLKLDMLRAGKPFFGREAFLPAAFGAFSECLEAAALANRADWVRSLLATGMGKNAGELLRAVASRAASAFACDAFDAITDECAYWTHGDGAFTSGWAMDASIRVGDSDQLPLNWKASLRRTLSEGELQELLTGFLINDVNAVRSLLFDPEQQPTTGQFHVRVLKHPHIRLKNWLLESGAAVLTKSDGTALIIYSTDFQRHRLAAILQFHQLETGGGVDNVAESALFMAAMWGDIDIFLAVLTHETNELSQKPYAAPALQVAASVGAIKIGRRLLEFGIDVNWIDPLRHTALTRAATTGRTAVCALLLDHGALFELPPVEDDDDDEDEEAREDKESPTALIAAASAGQTGTCAFLISRGANIDSYRRGTNPVLIAAKNGWTKTCQLLAVAGASLDEADTEGNSVLSHAAHAGNIALYEFLRARGANPLTVANPRQSPLMMAAEADHDVMLAHLLQTTWLGRLTEYEKYKLLLTACESGAVHTAKLMLNHGAGVDFFEAPQNNVLVAAIQSDSLITLQLILPRFSESDYRYRLVALNLAISKTSSAWRTCSRARC